MMRLQESDVRSKEAEAAFHPSRPLPASASAAALRHEPTLMFLQEDDIQPAGLRKSLTGPYWGWKIWITGGDSRLPLDP
ncbi:hypothetical protein B7G68_13005 [Caulobacter segnis]|uniref:Uncharacterized protein n=1 Tax=Caulobacter segnis TaxID=88688 RepID=A0ABM6THN3_9CAUL|nr:hypothetical protein B7G68_13005 [Caulobacter segnis]